MTLFSLGKEESSQLKAINENYAVISFKPDGTILHANNNFLNVLGFSLSEIVGKNHKIFCDDTYVRTKEYQDFWIDLNKGYSQISEFKRVKKNKESIFIQASYIPVKNKKGEVYKVIKFAQDITEKKLLNLDHEGQLEAISKSQAVIEFDMSGIILHANKNFLDVVGYTLNEIVGKHHSIFCEDSYKESVEYQQFWRKLNNAEFESGEFLRIAKNGKKVWIQATYNPIMDFDKKPFKVVKYATDITSRKNKMFEIEENVEKLSDSLTHLSNTSSSMSKGAKVTMNGSKEVSSSISEVNNSIVNIHQKVEDMLSSIKSISESSSKGKKIALEAQEQSKSTSIAINKLDEESDKIGEVINIITQIAFQTNILSLNAAVEAATAGEAGKGFAVVAGEVRSLASRSDEAAKEITQAVELIQSLVKSSLESITKIDKTIEEITSMSTYISDSIEKQESVSNDVSQITSKTSNDIAEISNTMGEVSQSSQKSKQESEETVAASKELISVSNELISILKTLK